MWFGYIGQVEIVNGGPGVGGRLNPARATLSNLAAFNPPNPLDMAKLRVDRVVIDKTKSPARRSMVVAGEDWAMRA